VTAHLRTVNGKPVRIVTSNDRPPIESRAYDWSAVTVDYEPGHPIGQGETEEAAIVDLLGQLEDRE
jgi:hypothetical protein